MICGNQKTALTLDMIYKGVQVDNNAMQYQTLSYLCIRKRNSVSGGFIHTLKTLLFFHTFNRNNISNEIKPQQSLYSLLNTFFLNSLITYLPIYFFSSKQMQLKLQSTDREFSWMQTPLPC